MKIKRISIFFFLIRFLIGCSDGNKPELELSGIIEATDINITSKAGGELRKIYFDEGSNVSQGDTIAEIDRETLLLQKKQAEAGVDLNQAQYNLTVRGFRSEDIKSAEINMKSAQSNFELAEYDKNNMESLYKSGSIAEKQWRDISVRYDVARAQFLSAEETYKKLQTGNRAEEIAVAKARLDQSIAQLELIEKQLRDCFILSPVNGTITHKVFEQNEVVNPGSIIFTVTQLEKVFLMVYVSEGNLGKVKYGQSAEVVVDSHKDKKFTGKVVYISSVAEFTPKNIQTKEDRLKQVFGVKLEIDNNENILKPGMPADAKLFIAE
jgi:HlyD family secretion protein